MAHGRTRGAQQAFELEARHHVGVLAIGVDILDDRRIKGAAARAQNDRSDQELALQRLLVVDDGLGETGVHALQALAAVAAVDAAAGLAATGGFVVSELHFHEVALALGDRQLGHVRPRPPGFAAGHGAVARMLILDRLATGGQVAAVDVAPNGFGRFLAGRHGADRDPWAGQQVAAGEHARPSRGVGDGVGLGRAVAREAQTGDLFERREVRTLADGRNDLVAYDLEFAAGDRHRPPPAGRIRLGQLHADAAQPLHPSLAGEDFLRRGQIGDLDAFGFRRADFLLPGRHLFARAAVEDGDRFGSEPDGRARDIDGDVSAADDGDLPADPGHASEVHLAQEVDALAHAVGAFAGNAELDTLVGAEGEVDRPEAGGEEAVDGDVATQGQAGLDFDPQVGDDLDLPVEDVAREAVRRDADPQHPAGLGLGFIDGGEDPGARQVIGAGQTGRAGADDGDRLRPTRRAGNDDLARVDPVGRKPLQVADGERLVQFRPAAGVFAAVGADAPQDSGKREVLHDDL